MPVTTDRPDRLSVAALLLGMLLTAAALLVLAGCGGEDAPAGADAGPTVRTVHAARAQSLADAGARRFAGTLRAPRETNLSFRVPGRVTRVAVDVGSRVAAGQTVAALDAEDYRLEVEAAEARHRRAEASARNAEAEYRRVKALYQNDNASLSAYDRARTAYETARASSAAAERQLRLARKRLGYTRLTAPAGGSVARVPVEAGENVAAGQPVARLASGDGLEVRVQVPEGVVTRLALGDTVAVGASALGDTTATGTITELATAADTGRPTYPVVVTLGDVPRGLRAGMSARVGLRLGAQTGVVVPTTAVSHDAGGAFVYALAPAPDSLADRADGVARKQRVTPGALTAEGLRLTSGLAPDARVVAAGLAHVTDGTPVRISKLLATEE
jgi:RND family efflux transporter MFP subunit